MGGQSSPRSRLSSRRPKRERRSKIGSAIMSPCGYACVAVATMIVFMIISATLYSISVKNKLTLLSSGIGLSRIIIRALNLTDRTHVDDSLELNDNDERPLWDIADNVEHAGSVVRWGRVVSSREQCRLDCESINEERNASYLSKGQRCNVFVYCEGKDGCGGVEYKSCWLKNWDVVKNGMPISLSKGKGTKWTSGLLYSQSELTENLMEKSTRAAIELDKMKRNVHNLDENKDVRMCGSPAVDAYERVNATCLNHSPTANLYRIAILEGLVKGDASKNLICKTEENGKG